MNGERHPFLGSAQAVAIGGLAGAVLTGPLIPFALLVLLMVLPPVWLLVCVPLYAHVPRTSRLWHPAICIPLGALSGGLLYLVLSALSLGGEGTLTLEALSSPGTLFMAADAVIVGMVTCLVAVRNAPRFLDGAR